MRNHRRWQPLFIFALILLFSALLGSPAIIQGQGETPESTPEVTPESTPEVTPELTPEVTPEVTPELTPELTPEVTPEPTLEVTPEAGFAAMSSMSGAAAASAPTQTFCRMEINDAEDSDPSTFNFSAADASNIDSFAWDFGDSTSSTAQSPSKTYSTAGTYNISLICTPTAGNGAPFTLTGQIIIQPNPVASFSINPSNVFLQVPPITVTTSNTSSGGAGNSYQWYVSTSADPMDAGARIHDGGTSTDMSYTVSSLSSYPATFHIHLFASNGGIASIASQSFVINAPAPRADFAIAPSDNGNVPLNVTVTGVDQATGPIQSWVWDTDNDGTFDDLTGPGPHSLTFSTPGSYPISMRVNGWQGSFYQVTRSVIALASGEPVNSIFRFEQRGNVSGGLVEVCFFNDSTGPIVINEWDLDGNGSYETTNNNETFCVNYPAGTSRTVRLRVSDGGNPATLSTSSRVVSVTAAPTAVIGVTPSTNITWGQTLNFNGESSTGSSLTYAWDFNRDSVTDSTVMNPSNVDLRAFFPDNQELGTKVIRLTVTDNAGRTAFSEVSIFIARLELTCDFTGPTSVLPGSAAQTYSEGVGNEGGRTVTYSWTITGVSAGLPASFTGSNFNVDWDDIGYGSFLVRLNASTPDGSSCTTSKTVTHLFPPLICAVNGTVPSPLYATGGTLNFSAGVTNLNSRPITYEWFVNGVSTGQTGSSYTYTLPTSTAGLPANAEVSYVATVTNPAGYTPASASCGPSRQFTVQPWPNFECTDATISGTFNPIPVTNAGADQTQSYSVSIPANIIAGRTVVYNWTVTGGVIQGSATGSTITVQWDRSSATLPPVTQDEQVAVSITIQNPDGTNDSCASRTAGVGARYENLICAAPSGDTNVVVGESESYTTNITNPYGRTLTISWELDQLTGAGSPQTFTGSGTPYTQLFNVPNATYRLRYLVSAAANTSGATGTIPADSCTSPYLNISSYNTGNDWQCESGLTGNNAPNTSPGSFSYQVDVDNGTNIPLTYTWTLRDAASMDYPLATVTGVTTNGIVTSPAFTLEQLGPLGRGDYSLRLSVTNPADTAVPPTVTCNRTLALNVGSFNMNLSYAANGWTNTALPVGQAICLTNTSTPRPAAADRPTQIDSINYGWTFSSAPNGVSGTSFTGTQLPSGDFPGGCFTYTTPDTYTITLQGESRSGSRTANQSITFNVYGLQSVIAERTSLSNEFAGMPQSFTATGVNINTYTWQFFSMDGNGVRTSLGTRTGQTVSNLNLFPTAGNYVAVVTGRGNLGARGDVMAEVPFTLLDADALSARFTASQYGGIASLNICFTDRSVSGSPITRWQWDFENDGTFDLDYTPSNIPGSICHTYPSPASTYVARLVVTNANFTDQATNVIRTYSSLEASATFAIEPQGGGNYCFRAIVPPGVNVTGWNYGHIPGNTASNGVTNSRPCHQYSGTGDYIVRMFVCDSGSPQTCGEVNRVVRVTPNPPPAPSIAINAVCSAARVASFTLTNSGAGMTTDDLAVVSGPGGVIASVPFRLDAGASTTLTFANQSGTITMQTTDTNASAMTTCYYPPELSVNAVCVNNLPVFTVENNRSADGPMPGAQSWSITSNVSGNPTVASGSFQLGVGQASQTFSVPANSDPYLTYTFTSNGTSANLTTGSNCGARPALSVVSVCGDPVTFTITNNGGAMLLTQSYTVTAAGGTDVTPAPGTLQLGAGQSTTISMSTLNPYPSYRLTTGGFAGSLDDTQDCANPDLVLTAACGSPVAFTIQNNGGAMVSPQAYMIMQAGSTNVTPVPGTFQLAAGAQTTISLPGLDLYAGYNFTSSSFAGTLSGNIVCTRPILQITATCDSNTAFTVRNTGGDMVGDHEYMLMDGAGNLVRVGTVRLLQGESVIIPLPGGANIYGAMINFAHLGVMGGLKNTCVAPSTPTPTPTPEDSRVIADGIGIPDWDSVPTCGRNCPEFRLYHTDEVGNWEIFRLDSADEATRTSIRENLSLSDPEADHRDMAPSLSPNNEWIVFTSNRDKVDGQPENWELYVAPSNGGDPTAVQRVTFNENAIDTDPVWGPNNWVVFESNRRGNWDLFAIDMSTGREYQLTDNPADDINPFWSPDGETLVFQSSRSGRWQVYELNLVSNVVRQLSDGSSVDVEPVYSNDGTRIAFRTYEVEDGLSRIAIMDMNGQNRAFVTEIDENATNHTWSPSDSLIAYQSDQDGDLDVYVYQVGTGETRKLTDNTIADYAPTWRCDDNTVIFTSDIAGNPDIYEEEARPIQSPAVLVEEDADQLTFDLFDDIYPQMTPPEENASREGRTSLGDFGEQTIFLEPLIETTRPDLSIDGIVREDWQEIEGCPG
jgi:Tol biopolymer transport system component/PKD repeat protein